MGEPVLRDRYGDLCSGRCEEGGSIIEVVHPWPHQAGAGSGTAARLRRPSRTRMGHQDMTRPHFHALAVCLTEGLHRYHTKYMTAEFLPLVSLGYAVESGPDALLRGSGAFNTAPPRTPAANTVIVSIISRCSHGSVQMDHVTQPDSSAPLKRWPLRAPPADRGMSQLLVVAGCRRDYRQSRTARSKCRQGISRCY